uniref:Olduvai domain-containing protein n=1 Tax=Theropithecus gelada TaxID=9565 RepID=A0A8D2EYH6_THEGE
LELLNSYQPYRSAFYSLEEQRVGLALEVDSEDPTMKVIRIHRLLEVQEPKVLHDSVDRCYSTPTSYLELSDSCQPYRSAFYSLEKQHVGLVLGGDRIKKDQEEEEDQGPHAPGNSEELLEGEDPEVLQCSLDICYSTPSSYLELPDSCQPYKSAFYSLEEQHVGLALYVISRFLTMKVIRLHLVFRIGVIFLH